jgi:hypothetical protein
VRKTKRKGLRAAKDGLRAQRLERFNTQRKKYEEMEIKRETRVRRREKYPRARSSRSPMRACSSRPLRAKAILPHS